MDKQITKLCACGCGNSFSPNWLRKYGRYQKFLPGHNLKTSHNPHLARTPLNWNFDLKIPAHAYLYGFLQTDSSFSEYSRSRGALSIELNIKDENILLELKKIIPVKANLSYRTRDTNFRKNAKSCTLRIYDKRFRDIIKKAGLPTGKKSNIIKPPAQSFSKFDYLRGLIDGDGSLGLTKQNLPFLSLCTSSESIAYFFISVIKETLGKEKTTSRNSRDKAFNISLFREDAQALAKILYYDDCLSLKRKFASHLNLQKWSRPATIKRRTYSTKRWSSTEDVYILSHSIKEAIQFLGRTKSSIKTRLWRLKCLRKE